MIFYFTGSGNITLENHRAVRADHYAACYGCLHWCPVHVTRPEFALLRNRKQYTHPDIRLQNGCRTSGGKRKA